MSFIFTNKTSHQEIVSGPLCTGETGKPHGGYALQVEILKSLEELV